MEKGLQGVLNMKHKVYRYIVNFEKEEKWLNEMAAKGLNFIDFSLPGRYLFEEGTPGEYIYRLELLGNSPRHPESIAYFNFMEETGVELVSTYLRWAWFRKKASDGPFELYSDYASKINLYKRVSWLVGIFGFMNLIIGIYNLLIGLFLVGPNNGHYFNSYISLISFLVAFVCFKAFGSYSKRIKNLKKENQIRE